MRLKIAARHSDFARLQAYRVADALRAVDAGLQIEFQFRASLGDLNQHDPLWKMPEKGVFTEDFVNDLNSGQVDMVVHSWKDLPTEERTESLIAATLPRADVRDLLLFRRDRLARAQSLAQVTVLSSSPRRAYNLEPFFRSHLPFAVNLPEGGGAEVFARLRPAAHAILPSGALHLFGVQSILIAEVLQQIARLPHRCAHILTAHPEAGKLRRGRWRYPFTGGAFATSIEVFAGLNMVTALVPPITSAHMLGQVLTVGGIHVPGEASPMPAARASVT